MIPKALQRAPVRISIHVHVSGDIHGSAGNWDKSGRPQVV